MPGVREMILRDRPSSLWMLRDRDEPAPSGPAGGGIAATTGLVFGEGALTEIYSADGRTPPAGTKWVDWSWGSARNWTFSTTDSTQAFSATAPQKTVGPYGLEYSVASPGDGSNALYLHATDRVSGADSTYDTTNDSVLLLYVKRNRNADYLRIYLESAAFGLLGNSVTIGGASGTASSVSGRLFNDTTKAWIPAQWAGLWLRITSGPANGLRERIMTNTATQVTTRGTWGGNPPGAGDSYAIDPFLPDTETMQPVAITLRGTSIAGTVGNFNLPAGALVAQIAITVNGSVVDEKIYLDELQFLQQRARSVPLVVGTRPEIRSDQTVWNFTPQFATRYVSGGDLYHLNYASLLDGACWGTTEEILEWAALKWFGDIRSGWAAAGGSGDLADLAKAISPLETGWGQKQQQGWEPWGDHSGTSSTIYTLNTFGVGQVKSKSWPYYPHTRLSTSWAADVHMSVLRYHYDSGTVKSDSFISMAGLTLVQKVMRATGAWATGSTLCDGVHGSENSWYARRVFGGLVQDTTSSDNGRIFNGNIVTRPWASMNDGDEFIWE